MFCSECGHELPEEARFCSMCGHAVPHMSPRRDQPTQTDWIGLVDEFDRSTGEAHSAAFAALYEASYDAVYAHVYRYAQNEDATNDAVQNAYIICWNHLDQLENARNFLPWMKRIAYNEFLGSVRKGSREQLFGVVSDSDGGEVSEEDFLADDTLPLPEDGLAAEELHRLLLDAINELPDGQRIAIKEYYFDNKPVQAIAADLGIPENTVKTHLSRGRKRIARSVDSYANAYGLKLVPLALIPFLATLIKEDVYACEHVATAAGGAATLASVQAALGIHIASGAAAAAGTAGAAGSVSATSGSAGAIGGTSAAGSAGASGATGLAGTAGSTATGSAGASSGMAAGGSTVAGATTASAGAGAGGTAAGATAASAAAGGSTAGAASAIGSGLAVKAGAGIVAVAVAAGGTGAYIHSQRVAETEPEPVVQEAATEQVTEVVPEEAAGPISQEERVAAMYQYISENMEIAGEATVSGGYHVINLAAPNGEYYGMTVGGYEADEGVYAVLHKDLDTDGEEELLVLSRTLEENTDTAETDTVTSDEDSRWLFWIQVMDMENDKISVSDAQEMLSLSNRSGPDGRTVTVYYKTLDDGIEILCRNEGQWTLNADGTDDNITAYRYQNGQLQYIDSALFGGSDPWGIGDDQELLAALRNMGLTISADEIAQYTYDYQGYMGYSGLLSDSEEGITNVLHMELVTYLDRDTWWDYYNLHGSGGDSSVLGFDTSPYYANLELTIDDRDNVVYAAE